MFEYSHLTSLEVSTGLHRNRLSATNVDDEFLGELAESLSPQAEVQLLFKLRPGSFETCGLCGMQNGSNVDEKTKHTERIAIDGYAAPDTKGGSPINKLAGNVLHRMSENSLEEGDYGCTLEELRTLMEARGAEAVTKLENEYGGAEGLCSLLKVDPLKGLPNNPQELARRRAKFGINALPSPQSKSFIRLVYDACKDPTLIILVVAGFISLGLSFYEPGQDDNEQENASLSSSIADLTRESDSLPPLYAAPRAEKAHGSAWIEGVAILICVAVVVLVTAVNDYSKERQFRGLQAKIETGHKFSVIRDGEAVDISVTDLVVGDIARVKYGDLFPADGFLLQGNDLKVDESSLTGESDLISKSTQCDPVLLSGTYAMEGNGKMLITAVGINSQMGIIMTLLGASKAIDSISNSSPPISISSSSSSFNSSPSHRISPSRRRASENDDRLSSKSILQTKLSKLALQIIYCGTTVATVALIVLITRFCIEHYAIECNSFSIKDVQQFVKFFIIAVTILVISIPEGLPLAIALALTYSTRKMMSDNNLVRHLDACETMGNATSICSDKTGTLTTNRMTVVHSYINGKYYASQDTQPTRKQLHEGTAGLLIEAISVNCAYNTMIVEPKKPNEQIYQIGNKTECALLGFVQTIDGSYAEIRRKYPEESLFKVYTFNSSRKSMMTVIRLLENGIDVGFRVYQKGAAEIVLARCKYFIGSDGQAHPFNEQTRAELIATVVTNMAENGLRTICIGYKDYIRTSAREAKFTEIPFDNESDVEWDNESEISNDIVGIALCGIQDPVRPEVPAAIEKCKRAGITVRMVTGDNINTARAIATACRILEPGEDFIALEGKEFNKRIRDKDGKVVQDKFDQIWPRLRVLARAQPADKYILVKGIINSKITSVREVVAVTGDGTNDAPALKKADVGFAMGITGTDVAKEASDIILTDDNFTSIVKAIMWGRNVYDSISKFLQFQLTVNVVAVLTAFVSACTIADSPLKAVHMLWINLIMDTLASLALATEMPTEELLRRKPYGRKKSLISRTMVKNIVCHAIYQMAILFALLFYGHKIFDIVSGIYAPLFAPPTQHFTIVFNTFVLMTLFNEINSRNVHNERNIFKGLISNKIFCIIWSSTFLAQVLIVQFGGAWFSTAELTVKQWIVCLLLGISTLLWGQVNCFVPGGYISVYYQMQLLLYATYDTSNHHSRRHIGCKNCTNSSNKLVYEPVK
uniref:Calcium-transporting ATPase n=1 Tax=Parascaris univalens TaxID=6257 RepID=A0A915AW34_PARUN